MMKQAKAAIKRFEWPQMCVSRSECQRIGTAGRAAKKHPRPSHLGPTPMDTTYKENEALEIKDFIKFKQVSINSQNQCIKLKRF